MESGNNSGLKDISYTTCASLQEHGELFSRFFHLLLNQEQFSGVRNSDPPITNFIQANFSRNGIDDTIQLVEQVQSQLPDRSHPFHLARYGGGMDPYGIIGDILATVLSAPLCTYLDCPVFTLMEETFKRALSHLVWNEDKDCHGDGTVCPGTEFALVLALRSALHKRSPLTKEEGLRKNSQKFAVFISQDGNAFAERACLIIGLGTSACYRIKTDEFGRMDTNHLLESVALAKQQGLTPFLVVATIGTANLGGIDPIEEISNVCTRTGMWLHIDGSDAGGYIFSNEFRQSKLKGVSHCQSFTLGEGVLGLTSSAAILVTRTNNNVLFKEAFSVDATDTVNPNNLYDYKYDNGNNTIQTSRRPDILPYWFLWKGTGSEGLDSRMEHINALAAHFHQLLANSPERFQLLTKLQQTTRIAFYYIPKSAGVQIGSAGYSKFMLALSQRLYEECCIVVSIEENPMTHFIVSFSNYILNMEGVDNVFRAILHLADVIEREMWGYNGDQSVEWEFKASLLKEVSSNLRATTVEMYKPSFQEFFNTIQDKCLYFQNMRQDPPFVYLDPEQLLKTFDFSLKTRINSPPELFRLVNQVILYSVHQGHPFFIFQILAAGLDPTAVIANILLSTSPVQLRENNSRGALIMRTMEKEVFRGLGRLIGYPEDCSGMFTAGGSISNISVMTLALYKAYPQLKMRGLVGSRLNPVLFVASNAHYSFTKGATLLGLGSKSCIPIPVDPEGRMIPSELSRAIQSAKKGGKHPFFIGATAGSTDIGMYERIPDISQVCKRHGLWLHVDGSYGGSIIFDEELVKKFMNGVNLSDSFNFNPHKWLGFPLETSIFLVKEANALESFQSGKPGGVRYETVFHHERRPNVLKFWLVWKVKGLDGMRQHIRHTLWIRDYALSALERRRPAFQPWRVISETAQVCFFYLPKGLRGQWDQEKDNAQFKARLNKVAIPLTSKLVADGKMMISVVKDGQEPWLLKIVVMNSALVPNDIDYFLEEIDKAGENMIV